MFNAAEVVCEELVQRLEKTYVANFGGEGPRYPELLSVVARTALERIADSDALYHEIEHTVMVTWSVRRSCEARG